MLDRVKLLKSMQSVAHELFVDNRPHIKAATHLWERAVADPLLLHKITALNTPWPVPTWHGDLDAVTPIKTRRDYEILSTDGSQVYPDRHMGTACYLVNIGTVFFRYSHLSTVSFDSQPFVFANQHQEIEGVQSTELVNGKRQELELLWGVQKASAQESGSQPFFLLYDGSLIFWHLESKTKDLQNYFLPKYLESLEQLFKRQLLTASYISSTRSRELINILRLVGADFDVQKAQENAALENIVDVHILKHVVPQNYRTTVFQNRSQISMEYPEHLQPHFFYLNVGNEIARVEIPAWVAQDDVMVNTLAACLLDQVQKGDGYPIALAEAHEQAVVKGPDREFFYQLLSDMAREQAIDIHVSPKLSRKRGMYI